MAIEDAVALGVVLERGLKRDEVPARLELYEKIRYKASEPNTAIHTDRR